MQRTEHYKQQHFIIVVIIIIVIKIVVQTRKVNNPFSDTSLIKTTEKNNQDLFAPTSITLIMDYFAHQTVVDSDVKHKILVMKPSHIFLPLSLNPLKPM